MILRKMSFSSHPISSHMSSKKVLLNCFHLIRAPINLSYLHEVLLNSSQLFCTPEKALTVREKSLAQKNKWAPRVFAHRHLRRRCIYTEKPFLKYFVLQSLHKALPSTTLYYKAAKPAPSTSQYHFAQQSLHALPSTTLYYKACTKHFPVLLCTTKLAQRKLLHTATSSAEKLLHTASFLNREAFTRFYTQQALHQEAFTHSKRLHTEQNTFTQSPFTHGKRLYTHRSFYTPQVLHTGSFYTQQAFTEKE